MISEHNFRVRTERHSVCVTDLPKLKGCGSPMSSNHLFVDTKPTSASIESANNSCHGPSNTVEMRSNIWNLPVVLNLQNLPLHLIFLRCYCSG